MVRSETSDGRTVGRRWVALACSLAALLAVTVPLGTGAAAAGPGGWDHLGDAGTPGSDSLNGSVYALKTGVPGGLYVGGNFTDAGGNANADRIASWDGTSWGAVSSPSSQISNGAVHAIASANGKVYAGGTFTDAGGNTDADFLAVWNGTNWAPFCKPEPAFGGNVLALQIIGSTLWVGGTFQNGAGDPTADYLLACDLNTGVSTSPFNADGDGSGAMYALTADSNGNLYGAGTFINLDGIAAADYVAYRDTAGGWNAMGSGPGPAFGAVTGITRSLTANGTDVYLGTDAKDVAGIPQADNVAKWNGTAWSAMSSNTGGGDGWFPASTFIYGLTTSGSNVFATGSFQNANGDPLADNIARFDGSGWGPVGSDGAGNGPWIGNGLALAVFDQRLYAGGSFTSAGGDNQASGAAFFPLSQPGPPPDPPPGPPVGPPVVDPLIPSPKPAVLPPPVLGTAVNVAVRKGTVLVATPARRASSGAAQTSQKGLQFVPLTAARQIPVGSFLDTRKGTVALTSASTTGDKTQAGGFSAGIFQVLQSRKRSARGLTELRLKGASFSSCLRARRSDASASRGRLSRGPIRRLRANARGRFRTRGRHSAATVRGTIWDTTDRCDGTLTKVSRGSVTVRDFRRRKTIVVRAGKSYLARAPR